MTICLVCLLVRVEELLPRYPVLEVMNLNNCEYSHA